MIKGKGAFVIALSIGLAVAGVSPGGALSGQVREFLRQRIEAAGHPLRLSVGEELIYSSVALPKFYLERTFRPAWSDDRGPLPLVDSLLAAIGQADREGLFPADYHQVKIEEVLAHIRGKQQRGEALNPLRLVDLDLLSTDAFLVYASHLFGGKVDPETFDPEWHPSKRDADFAGMLEKALSENRLQETLAALLPDHREYFQLRDALARYRTIAAQGGWPPISPGPTLTKGGKGERVAALRQRLILADDLESEAPEAADYFDAGLEQAVKRFQQRHGLEVDGVVGRLTLGELNVPVEQRLEQVVINLERWRWLPQSLGERYILVNIANFELEVVENQRRVMAMRAIVGRQYRRTPVFTGLMTYLVFSPYWNIPPGITARDVLPQVQKDVGYLAKNQLRVLRGWGAHTVELDPATVDWANLTAATLPYRFRQDPGPHNSLGLVKFMFPNRFNVYLHDTPARELFLRVVRDFSSGCIRVEQPAELAAYLLADRADWTRAQIEAAMESHVERTVSIARPLPVHLLYWTAWATEDRMIHFRRDIYQRDQRVAKALQVSSPAARQAIH